MSEDQGVFVKNTVFVDQAGMVSKCWDGPEILYKYRCPSMRALESLIHNQVWFAQPKDFNDPFESSKFFDRDAFEEMIRCMKEDGCPDEAANRKFVVVDKGRDIEDSGVFCLCRTADNLAMWSYYGADKPGGKGLKGFAVGYDLVSFLDNLQPEKKGEKECTPRNRFVLDVAYRNERKLPRCSVLLDSTVVKRGTEYLNMHAAKAIDFQHEDEIRIVITPSPDNPPAQEDPYRWEKEKYVWPGYGKYGHAPEAIREIVFGELIEPVHKEMIRKIMAGRDVVFKRASRDLQSLSIKLETEA